MSTTPAQTPPAADIITGLDPAPLAARLILSEPRRVIAAWLLIALPALLSTYLSANAQRQELPFMLLGLLQRCAELSALVLVALQARHLLASGKVSAQCKPRSLLEVFAVGLALWMLLIFPFLPGSQLPSWGILLLASIGIFCSYAYYFFVPALLLGTGDFRQRMQAARSLVQLDWRMPLRVFLPPLALWLLITNLCAAPAPDERYLELTLLSQVLGAGAWTLGLYLEVAAWLTFTALAPQTVLETAPAMPSKRYSNVGSLRTGITHLLRNKTASWLTLVALGLWVANYSRLVELPPAADVEIESLEVQDSDVLVTLAMTDTKYGFRAIQLGNFILAGEKRVLVSDKPVEVLSVNGFPYSRYTLAPLPTRQTVQLKFSTARSASSLRSLQDLYLWYRGVKVRLLRFPEGDAQVEAAAEQGAVPSDGAAASPSLSPR